MMPSPARMTMWEEAQSRGISRREFPGFRTTITAMLGLPATSVAEIAKALDSKPRPPVV
jgi:Ni,Fe-hydrogenase I small subunit